MDSRSSLVAWSLWATTLLLWCVVIGLIASHRVVAMDFAFVFPRAAGSVLALSTATVGALIASRRPTNPIGWIFCGAALVWCAGAISTEYAIHALIEDRGLPGGELAAWLASWVLIPSGTALIFVLLLVPSGRLPSPLWKLVGWTAGIGTGLTIFGTAFAPGPLFSTLFSDADNPLAIRNLPEARSIEYIGACLILACGMLAAAGLITRLKRSMGLERQQLKWFAFGETLTVAIFFIVAIPVSVFGVPLSSQLGLVLAGVWVLGLSLVPITTAIAILRYRLWDIDLIINRALVYGSVTAILAGLFAALSVVTQHLVLAVTGQGSEAVVVLTALVVTALFQPLRARVQIVVDHRFYRRKYDATQTLGRFVSQVRDEVELDQLTTKLTAVVRDTMRPAHVSLWLRPPAGSRPGPEGLG